MKTTSLMPNIARPIKIPKRNDERIILHFDYDCFYASVFENENPALRSRPLGVRQKSILATCNYVARARGVRKLMLVSEARRLCPDLVVLDGEDLARFRDASKRLWAFLRPHAWSRRAERLGLDEVFLDVTDVVAYNGETLNPHALGASFFHLDRADPVKGFAFDASAFYGCVRGSSAGPDDGIVDIDVADPLCVRLMLASHLAGYLRHKLHADFGYTSSGGVATSKLLAKLVGSVNKPNNQTTLLATAGAGGDAVVEAFVDAHGLRKIPGIGSRIAQLIEDHLLLSSSSSGPVDDERRGRDRDREATDLTVGEVRRYPGMSADLLEQVLDRPGAERGGGSKVWNFLHGVDPSEVKEASDVPTQISIEDTYMSRPLQTPAEVVRELQALATSLIRRMRVDLTEPDLDAPPPSSNTPRWLAYPKTLRLSTRTKPKQSAPPSGAGATATGVQVPSFNRSSRSAPLPSFVFQLPPQPASTTTATSTSTSVSSPSPSTPSLLTCEDLASRLVTDSLLPLFRRLHPERGGWGLALLNVCVTNMVPVAAAGADSGAGAGAARDIGRMFRTQEDKLREWTVYDTSPAPAPTPAPASSLPTARNGPDVRKIPVEVAELVDRDAAEGVVIEEAAEAEEKGEGDEEAEEEEGRDARYRGEAAGSSGNDSPLADNEEEGDDDIWEEREVLGSPRCQICGHAIPVFALAAHQRFHSMDE
ncbi:hypothetical protein F5Y14DRAFT_454050 [Nemania sp. NC0429]|nr:hypothetical protein F5Y14DRAFT_454050 [Nemania sp. NC0429]